MDAKNTGISKLLPSFSTTIDEVLALLS